MRNLFPSKHTKQFQNQLSKKEKIAIKQLQKLDDQICFHMAIIFLLAYGSMFFLGIKPVLTMVGFISFLIYAVIFFMFGEDKINQRQKEIEQSDAYKSLYHKAENYVINYWN